MENAIPIGKVMHAYCACIVDGGGSGSPLMPQAESPRHSVIIKTIVLMGYSFNSFSQRLASRFTSLGAVPPKLVREATEASTRKIL